MRKGCFSKTTLVVVTLLLCACSHGTHHQTNSAQLRRANWHWDSLSQHYSRYARQAVRELGGELLLAEPADISRFCWNYAGLDREARVWFWSDLLAAISKLESNHNETLQYTERFRDTKGSPVVSRGLLQLSLESSASYQCGIVEEQQLHSAELNIRCATRILNRWIAKDQVISRGGYFGESWQGAARYWSVLRDTNKRRLIQQRMQNEPYCRSTSFDRLAYRRSD